MRRLRQVLGAGAFALVSVAPSLAEEVNKKNSFSESKESIEKYLGGILESGKTTGPTGERVKVCCSLPDDAVVCWRC
jgi:hypothetical protein